MYAFCTRAPPRRRPKTKDLALQSQADGGIRTLDPRFTRAVQATNSGQPRAAETAPGAGLGETAPDPLTPARSPFPAAMFGECSERDAGADGASRPGSASLGECQHEGFAPRLVSCGLGAI